MQVPSQPTLGLMYKKLRVPLSIKPYFDAIQIKNKIDRT
jgi:hypothetical protein